MSSKSIPQDDSPKQLDLFSPTDNYFPFPEVADPDDMPRNTHVRRDSVSGEWVYSVVDLIAWANKSDSVIAANTWRVLKHTLTRRGNEVIKKLNDVKMIAIDGKMYQTQCANRETLLRLIQEIPAARTDIIKDWLARVGNERLEEIENPEKILPAAERRYINAQMARGVTEKQALEALNDRRAGRESFKVLMALVKEISIDTPNYGQLTNVEYQSIFGKTAKQLETVLNSKSIRDDLPPLQYSYIRTAELGFRAIIQHQGRMTNEQIVNAMRKHAIPLGKLLQELCEVLGIDLVTGKPLLSAGKS